MLQVSLAGQTGKAPGGQEVKMLPVAEAGRVDALDQAVSPSNEAGPSKPPAAAKQLQGQPGAPGRGAAAEAGMNNARTTPTRTPVGSASSSSLKAAGLLDPNRAFQAINAETLEVASAQADYPIPPITTQVPKLGNAAVESVAAALVDQNSSWFTGIWFWSSHSQQLVILL